MMQAITIRGGKGGADALQVQEIAVPVLRAGHVLVRVRAAGVNRPDILQRSGLYPPPPGRRTSSASKLRARWRPWARA
jgi:NADPH:quinone reductase-like Zn-dependent oxidoreductase